MEASSLLSNDDSDEELIVANTSKPFSESPKDQKAKARAMIYEEDDKYEDAVISFQDIEDPFSEA